MANKMRLRIVTPNRKMFDDEVEMVIMRTVEGDIGILPGHEPLTTVLSYGVMRIVTEDENQLEASVIGGFVEIGPQLITVLSDAAEWPDEIDAVRAERAKERAERRLQERSDSVDVKRAELALRRALVRKEVSSYNLTKRIK